MKNQTKDITICTQTLRATLTGLTTNTHSKQTITERNRQSRLQVSSSSHITSQVADSDFTTNDHKQKPTPQWPHRDHAGLCQTAGQHVEDKTTPILTTSIDREKGKPCAVDRRIWNHLPRGTSPPNRKRPHHVHQGVIVISNSPLAGDSDFTTSRHRRKPCRATVPTTPLPQSTLQGQTQKTTNGRRRRPRQDPAPLVTIVVATQVATRPQASIHESHQPASAPKMMPPTRGTTPSIAIICSRKL